MSQSSNSSEHENDSVYLISDDYFSDSVAPDVKIYPTGVVNVTVGAIFQAVCETKGVPPPIIRWKHNGQRVVLPNNDRRRYLVHVKHYNMAGLVECVADNGVGIKSVGLQLVVNCESNELSVHNKKNIER